MRGCGRDQHAGEHGPVHPPGRRRPPLPHGRLAPNHREWDADDLEVEGELPDGPRRRVPAQHREPRAPVDRACTTPSTATGCSTRSRFEDGRARRTATASCAPTGSSPSRTRRGPLWTGMLDLPGALGAGGRLGRSRPHEGRVEHRRRRAQRPGAQHLLPVRRRVPARPDDAGRRGQGAVDGGVPEPHRRVGPPEARRAHRRAPRVRLRQGVRPYLHYGVVEPDGRLVHSIDVPLPGPRLPHDMAFTEHYAIFNDLPLFWDPDLLDQGIHLPRFYPDQPSRFGIVPRRGAHRRDPLVRGRPDLRPALDQRLRGRRRDRARRLLPAPPLPEEGGRRVPDGDRVPPHRPRAARRPAAPLALRPGDRADEGGAAVGPDRWSSG